MYKALYRKWRPLVFADVVGQRHVTETLKNECVAGRLSHAYLFTGTRGTGKTTCAKILARAVNCETPVRGDPCNQCPSCLGILNGSVLDVVEMDAASHTGVDNIRTLREELVYTPAAVKRRVYIIDEVHMLSSGAFNALLTVLEEPPPHVLFAMATTEIHKVPATILSRCQRFAFRRIAPADILARLRAVAAEEGLSLTEGAARMLTRLADGSLRDALSLLDQCVTAGPSQVDEPAVCDALGLAGLTRISDLAAAVAAREAARALSLFADLMAAGRDMASVLDELCVLLRDLLLSAYTSDLPSLSGIEPDGAAARSLAAQFGQARLLSAIALIQEAQGLMARGGNRHVDMELCLLRLCDERLSGDATALAARVAALEQALGTRGPALANPGAAPAAVGPTPPPAAAQTARPTGAPETDTAETDAPETDAPEMGAAEADDAAITAAEAPAPDDFAAAFLRALEGEISLFSTALLRGAHFTVRARELLIAVEAHELERLRDKDLLDTLTRAAARVLGRPVEIVVSTGLPPSPTADRLAALLRRGEGVIRVEP
ncbi:MAG: DNA polymerase III subunit gamma/tau [Oscillospiraceae bacterium]|nr:DNA polymerase III subunit gamma/tau [Oscillospiraceae bacterium]